MAAIPGRRPRKPPHAIRMLMEEHKQILALLKEFQQLDRDDYNSCAEMVELTCVELKIHSIVEDEIFYPAVRAGADSAEIQNLLIEAELEHQFADQLMDKLAELEPEDAQYAAHFAVLSEYVKHHIRQEEKRLFPLVKQTTKLDLDSLASEMRARRDVLLAEIDSYEEEIEQLAAAESATAEIPFIEDAPERRIS